MVRQEREGQQRGHKEAVVDRPALAEHCPLSSSILGWEGGRGTARPALLSSASCPLFSVFLFFAASVVCCAGAQSPECTPQGAYVDRTGANITLTVADGTQHVVVTADAQSTAGWSWGNGTINPRPSMWCRCGAGGSCQSSLGKCRALTMRFFNKEHALVRTATAAVEHDCIGIASWSDGGSAWWKPDATVEDVHMISMVHLDIGFTNSTRGVCDSYFDEHFPRAIETATELRRRKGMARFQWTTFPWLVQEYLDGAAGCASRLRTPQELMHVRQAIERDDIVWHANALNSFFELYDRPLMTYSLGVPSPANQIWMPTTSVLIYLHLSIFAHVMPDVVVLERHATVYIVVKDA